MGRKCRLSDVEDILAEEEFLYDLCDVISFDNTEDYIEVYKTKIVIPSLGIYVKEGTWITYYEDEGEYMPDFSLSVIYNIDEEDPQNYMYWEQDGIVTTLFNWTRYNEKSFLLDYECEIVMEEQ